MGTSWNVRCIDCDKDAGVYAEYSPIYIEEVRQVIRLAPRFANLTIGAGNEIEIRISSLIVPSAWLAEHASHQLRPVSEYGAIDGTCAKETKCEVCSLGIMYCEKEIGHEGKCGRNERC